MTTPLASLSSSLGSRLLAGAGTLALLGAIGLMTSRPARTAGGPVPVTVANVPLETKPTDNPAKQPVQVQLRLTQNGINSTFYTVPAGKRLVIEYVSAFSNVPNDPDKYNFIIAAGGVYTDFTLIPNGSPFVGTSQKVLLYAEAGAPVDVFFQYNGSNSSPQIFVAVTGYLVDVP